MVRADRYSRLHAAGRLPLLTHLLNNANQRSKSVPGQGGKSDLRPPGAKSGAEHRRASLAEQRRALPDQPGVYLFRDADGRVIYVGKAKSIRKRVASHFSKAQVRGQPRPRRDGGERRARSSASSSPARPRRCWPSRASSSSTGRASTSACATTSPTRSSRSRWTRTFRGSTSPASVTAPAAPTSVPTPAPSACARRSRCSPRCSCSAPAPAPSRAAAAAALPRLLHQALRGALRRLRLRGGVPAQHRRRDRLPLRALHGRSSAISSSACARPPRRRSSSRPRWSATGCAPCAR